MYSKRYKRHSIHFLFFVAWEILTDPKKRRQFDSCDPTFDESLPPIKLSGDFYEIYSEKFASESRQVLS
jgi:hypothetical protein